MIQLKLVTKGEVLTKHFLNIDGAKEFARKDYGRPISWIIADKQWDSGNLGDHDGPRYTIHEID